MYLTKAAVLPSSCRVWREVESRNNVTYPMICACARVRVCACITTSRFNTGTKINCLASFLTIHPGDSLDWDGVVEFAGMPLSQVPWFVQVF
jgi:hypothetical protein